MPQGTYRPGRRARIEADEQQNVIRFFDHESGELLEQLPLASGIGQCIRSAHPGRDKRTQHKKLIDAALEGFGQDEAAIAFLEGMLALKPRYTRDQLSMVIRLQERYGTEELARAASYWVEREPCENTGIKLPVKYRVVTAQQRPLEAYAALVKGGEAL